MDLRNSVKPTCLVFDLDGTIAELAIDWGELKNNLETIAGHSIETFEEGLRGAEGGKRSQLLDTMTSAEIEGANKARLLPGSKTILPQLAATYKLAIMTRNSRKAAYLIAEKCGVAKLAYIVGREDVTIPKPNPEGLNRIAQHFSIQPSEVLVVGDTYHDVEASHRFGARVVCVRNPHVANQPIGADWQLDSLRELPGLLKVIGNQ